MLSITESAHQRKQTAFSARTQLFCFSKSKTEKKRPSLPVEGLSSDSVSPQEKQELIRLLMGAGTAADPKALCEMLVHVTSAEKDYPEMQSFFLEMLQYLSENSGIQDVMAYLETVKKEPVPGAFLAFTLERTGDLTAAATLYENNTAKLPVDNPIREFYLNYLLNHQPEEGMKQLEQLIAKKPLPRLRLALSKICYAKKQYQKSWESIEKVTYQEINGREDIVRQLAMLKMLNAAHLYKYPEIVRDYDQAPIDRFEDLWFLADQTTSVMELTEKHRALMTEINKKKHLSLRLMILKANVFQALRQHADMVRTISEYLETKARPEKKGQKGRYDFEAIRFVLVEAFDRSVISRDNDVDLLESRETLEAVYPWYMKVIDPQCRDQRLISEYLVASRLLEKTPNS